MGCSFRTKMVSSTGGTVDTEGRDRLAGEVRTEEITRRPLDYPEVWLIVRASSKASTLKGTRRRVPSGFPQSLLVSS